MKARVSVSVFLRAEPNARVQPPSFLSSLPSSLPPTHHPGLNGRSLDHHHIARLAPCQETPTRGVPLRDEDGPFLFLLVADDDGTEVKEREGGNGIVQIGGRGGEVLEVGGVGLGVGKREGRRRRGEDGQIGSVDTSPYLCPCSLRWLCYPSPISLYSFLAIPE